MKDGMGEELVKDRQGGVRVFSLSSGDMAALYNTEVESVE